MGKCKKLDKKEIIILESIIELLPLGENNFFDFIEAPGVVISLGDNGYVKKGNGVLELQK